MVFLEAACDDETLERILPSDVVYEPFAVSLRALSDAAPAHYNHVSVVVPLRAHPSACKELSFKFEGFRLIEAAAKGFNADFHFANPGNANANARFAPLKRM